VSLNAHLRPVILPENFGAKMQPTPFRRTNRSSQAPRGIGILSYELVLPHGFVHMRKKHRKPFQSRLHRA
jgi:hypothetical protein